MKNFLEYIFYEVKNKRLPKTDAVDLIRQFQTNSSSRVSCFLHPLLQQNTSDFSEQRFSSTFTGNEFFLTDHVVKGQRVLPGVAYLEMARAAVEQTAGALNESVGIRLKNVVWSQAVVVADQPVQLHVGLYPEETSGIVYEIYSYPPDDSEPIVHSQGNVTLSTVVKVPPLNLQDLQTQCSQMMFSPVQCYEAFKAMGLEYGPGHQGIEKLYVGQGQVLAKLFLPTCVFATQKQFVLHPSLMDAALQASIGFMLASEDTIAKVSLKPMLPFALQELEIFDHSISAMWALVRYSAGSKAGDSVQKFDIDLCDEQGNVCVRMKGFSSRVLEGEMSLSAAPSTLGVLMLQPSWKEQDVAHEVTIPAYDQHLVLLCELGEVSQESIETQINGVRCLTLQPEQKGIEERFNSYAAQAFKEINNIFNDKHAGKVLVQIIIPHQGEQQLFSGLSGLLKTARLEKPKIIGQLIEMESGEKAEGIVEKLLDNSRNPKDSHIRYQANKRYVAGWSEVKASQEAVSIPWKDQGVYLITGGAGGLGLIFAREIAHKVKDVTLILTGRTPLNANKQAGLKELEALGARIEYKQLDVTQKQKVADLIKNILEKFGNLHGAIHCAGVIKDNFILKKTQEEFQAVLAPKVKGLVYLDQASKDLNLDCFVLFSSLAGTMGNPGQADYSTANAFMDAFAHYRNNLVASGQRYGRTLSIDWPLWQEGGMSVDEKTAKIMKEEIGMIPIQTESGTQALYQGLASGQAQVLVAEGDLKRLRATLLKPQQFSEETLKPPSRVEESKLTPVVDQQWLKEKAENYFKKLLSSVIKLPASRIEVDAPMEKYGIDSVMVMQLVNQLEKTFGSLSKTLFFEYQNIAELTGYFLGSHRDQLTVLLGIEDRATTTSAANDSIAVIEPEKPAFSSKRRSRFASMHIETQPEKEKGALDIAIIGLSGRFPGAKNIQEFWQNLKDGRDCITEIPKDRWDYNLYFDEDKNKPGKVYSKWGGFLEGVDQFDPLFFNISPLEAEIMDPQERLFLQCVYETLEDAGYTREALNSNQGFGLQGNVGVYVGVMYEEYQLYGAQEQILGRSTALAGSPSSIANRISYFCNFHGPSIAIDTMCSSSLTAIHLACQSLQRGGCELAIAGGVNVSIHPNKYLMLSQGKFASSKGRCESFGQGGDGYVPGEGVGAVLLKPLSKAIADEDHIYGVIKATAINHGGKTNGYTVPNPSAQASVIGVALKEAGIDPRLISYIEAHGTGTSLGDPIEITGLTKAFQEYTKDKQYCAIGSAKSNIGHCESAAGIAGLAKVLLQLKHRQLAPSLHSKTLNPNIDFAGTPFIVQQELAEWRRPVVTIDGQTREYPRIAGLSSFGAGGSNAHVIIGEYIPDRERTPITVTSQNPAIIVMSAKNEERLKEQLQQFLTAIQTQHFTDNDLADIAYTLQVGREAMEDRLAIIVASLQELVEKLQGYLDGQDNIDEIYRGQVKRKNETLAVFEADEDMTHTIDAWIAKGKYAKLLDLWVKGLSFDWNKLYPGGKHRRISLPTYPFAKESYWIPERYWVPDTAIHPAATLSIATASIHPLLHQNTSDLVEQRFTSTFTGQEFFLTDHRVKGQRVLPGVAYLEMAWTAMQQAAAALQTDKTQIRLQNIVWAHPIIIKDKPVPVHIGLYPEETGQIAYEIYSQPDEAGTEPIVHSQGVAVLSTAREAPVLDLSNLRAVCSQSAPVSNQLYEAFRTVGLDYGPAHQGIEQLYIGENQVLAKLTLPSSVSATQVQFVLHPSLMDSALQATIGLMMSASEKTLKPSLPFALEELEVFRSCTSTMWALIRYSGSNTPVDRMQKLDIDLCDEQGHICVRMKAFTTRTLEAETDTATIGTLMLESFWKEQTVSRETPEPDYAQHLVILCEPDNLSPESITTQMNKVSCLILQSSQREIGDRFQTYAVQVFEKLQGLLKDKSKDEILLQIVVSNQSEQQLYLGLTGLLKTARMENPKLIGQLIAVESRQDSVTIIEQLRENSRSPMDHIVRYQDGKRFVTSWSEVEASSEAVIPWKNQGVYLITGGAGGLGLIFAQEIARKAKDTTLVLTGRSPLGEDKQAKLKELETSGARIIYRQVDVTDKKAVTSLIKDILHEFGNLNGIIHAAGMLKDNFIIKKTREEFLAVLAPKVTGLVNLDQASQNQKLDFFVFFSSIAGAMGNPGQADYSTANAFMDAYSSYRHALVTSGHRYGRTLSINWPLWQEGRMNIDAETEKMMMEYTGMTPMKTDVGIQALYQGLASGQAQVLVTEGNLKRLRATLLELRQFSEETLKTSSSGEESKATPAVDQVWIKEKAENYFKKLLSSIIKLPVSRIEAEAPMEKYGIDSIMVMQLINQLEKTFGSLSKTLFFEYQNIKELTGYFLESHRDQMTAVLGIEELAAATNERSQDSIPLTEPVKPALSSRIRSRFASMRLVTQPVKEKDALDIAIIGLSGRYPGARNILEFWQNLKDGKDCITEIPKDHWDYNLYFDEDKDKPGKVYSKWGGFLEGVDQFDPLFFNISPREAEIMDPQERLFLQCVYETLEDAGYTREALGSYQSFGLEGNVGVYVGVMYEEYQLYGAQEQIQGRPITLTGNPSSIANRISYFCNFHGPSMAVDTMCSSSLTAIHLACQSLQRGGCELAIAGGVNVSIHPNKYLALSQGKFVSSKGRCESFGQGGDGYVPGEGVGAVLLKPLSKAIADGDHIYGVIKATAINHGGKTNGYTVPNPNAQASVIGAALKEARIDPRMISYIEAHGTGTSLGDPIEITGLTKAFQEYTKDKQYCAIGSAKSNIGHCESAAGIAGVTKVLLQFKHGQLAPSLHSETLNPNIDFASTPFIVQQELAEWKRPVVMVDGQTREYSRIAGISAFGAGGSNAHVVIEEYIPERERTPFTVTSKNPAIIVLSAKSEERLKEQSQKLLTAIQTQPFSDTDLADIAYTLQVGREAMEERLAITAVSLGELKEKLQGYLNGQENIDNLYRGQVKRNKEALVVFTADEELQEAINKWIQRGKYAKLIDLWVKGLSFDWNKLYSSVMPRRISLPTYPFTKESYWIPERQWVPGIKDDSNKNPVRVEYSHPVKTEKVILTKEWHKKTTDSKVAVQAGVIVVLGTKATADLTRALFEDSEIVQVLPVVHGKALSSEEISTDFYSPAAGEVLYQQIKDKQNSNRILGVIDITAYDNEYEQSTTVESGKIIFLQKLIENDRNEEYRLLQVTHKLQAFQLAQTTMQGSRLAGLYRMLSAEYKQIGTMTLDSDCLIQDHKTLAKQIQTEFLNTDTQNLTECCYRENERYEPCLTIAQTNEEIQAKHHMPKSYTQNDVILITGGSQGIGATIAQYLVSQGVKNLVIMGRESLPEPSEWKKPGMTEKIKRLQSLMDQGARIRYSNTPLTDEEGIKAMVEDIRRDMGPITGVFHCAGSTSKNPAFFKKPLQDFATVCEPKIKGLVTLHRAMAEEPLKFFILFSSISSIVPTLASGQSDYAIANAYLDYYALNQAGEGRTYFKSIQWPAWGETGMAKGGMRTPAYAETGLVSLTTPDGLALLEIIQQMPLIVSLPCVVVPGEFTPEHLLKNMPGRKESGRKAATPGSPLDLRMSVIQWLKQVFSSELKLPLAQLDDNKPFEEYGVESIMLAQLTQKLQVMFCQPLDPALLLEYSTISALADYFMANHATDLQKSFTLADDSISASNASSPTINAALHSNSKPFSRNLTIGSGRPLQSTEDIAVVGISCRLPGSPTKEAYWDVLTKGVSAIRQVPKERWIPKENRPDYGGWIEDVDLFDPKFFNINERDAAIMDPQARIILEESLRAIYDAGYEHKQLSGQKIGVYIGGRSQTNLNLNAVLNAPNPILGIGQNYLATNISRYFNFKGPSLVVDTACSSGISGMLFACDSLREGRIDMGLAGAVNVLATPFTHDLFAARNILSKRGEFHIFDRRSDGEVLGEGAGVVLLKRLNDAIKDGNQIYGVIKAIAENNDGQTLGPGSPNINAQKQVMLEALSLCGKQPAEIGYIEVNGGGSPVIDSIEIKALSEVYNLGNQALASCVIGSVKPNIGHLLLTSGMAGFIRCVLSVYHKQIPPFLSASDPFEYYDFSASRIHFNRETIDWRIDPGKKRLAAQSCFPDGGTNCHLLIEEFVPDEIYQQQYFSKEGPQMTRKRFPLHSISLLEPSLSNKKEPDWKMKQDNHRVVPSLWGEYHEI